MDDHNGTRVLEVKGRKSGLRLSDVRELDNWVRDAVATETWQGKGLLIANLKCNEDPKNRKQLLPKNTLDTAKNFNIAILTTAQLFCALASNQKGELDKQAFWDQVFSTAGVCDLPDLQ